mmetsp:Transcript_31939/g.68977  ORF Transcript_31939/g.68977 Transcript_31939/m.68977 type:complete len:95 (+) Transcript_31939:1622-1906(+)
MTPYRYAPHHVPPIILTSPADECMGTGEEISLRLSRAEAEASSHPERAQPNYSSKNGFARAPLPAASPQRSPRPATLEEDAPLPPGSSDHLDDA